MYISSGARAFEHTGEIYPRLIAECQSYMQLRRLPVKLLHGLLQAHEKLVGLVRKRRERLHDLANFAIGGVLALLLGLPHAERHQRRDRALHCRYLIPQMLLSTYKIATALLHPRRDVLEVRRAVLARLRVRLGTWRTGLERKVTRLIFTNRVTHICTETFCVR